VHQPVEPDVIDEKAGAEEGADGRIGTVGQREPENGQAVDADGGKEVFVMAGARTEGQR